MKLSKKIMRTIGVASILTILAVPGMTLASNSYGDGTGASPEDGRGNGPGEPGYCKDAVDFTLVNSFLLVGNGNDSSAGGGTGGCDGSGNDGETGEHGHAPAESP